MYRETVRTNNDVEGWHHRLSTKARRSQLDLYQLVPVLYKEAQLVHLQVTFVSERRLTPCTEEGVRVNRGTPSRSVGQGSQRRGNHVNQLINQLISSFL